MKLQDMNRYDEAFYTYAKQLASTRLANSRAKLELLDKFQTVTTKPPVTTKPVETIGKKPVLIGRPVHNAHSSNIKSHKAAPGTTWNVNAAGGSTVTRRYLSVAAAEDAMTSRPFCSEFKASSS
jgi:hypothetical protein